MFEERSAEADDDRKNVARTASALNTSEAERRSSTPKFGNTNRCIIAVIVYLALLLDNVLLTVIGRPSISLCLSISFTIGQTYFFILFL